MACQSLSRSKAFHRRPCRRLWVLSTASVLFFGLPTPVRAVPDVPLADLGTPPAPLPPSQSIDNPDSRGSSDSRGSYVLGAGDRIRIDIFQVPQYSGEYEILSDGSLNLPRAGRVFIEGRTLESAADLISAAYATTLRRPIVNITLLLPRPLRIGIAGEVFRPGAYILDRTGTQFPTLISALERAGGVTQVANLRQIQVRRSSSPTGSPQTLVVDLWQFLQTGDLGYDLSLRDGDSIYIPAVDTFNAREASQIASANFSASDSRPLNIAVIGAVFRPGPYTVAGDARTGQAGLTGQTSASAVPPTVTRAIQAAGGIKPDANIREIQVYRRTRTGAEQAIPVNLWRLLQVGELSEDIVLQEGDTVFIPTATTVDAQEVAEIAAASFSPNSIRVNIVGEVSAPGVIEVPPNTPLSQGLLSAGGFNNRASRGNVDLIRLNLDGSVTRRTIPVDFSQGIDEGINPPLRNNDVIIVRRSLTATFGDTLETIISPLSRALTLFTIPATILQIFR